MDYQSSVDQGSIKASIEGINQHLACVADISKKACEGNETAND